MKRRSIYVISAFCLVFTLSACKKEDKGDVPMLPPVSSMSIDLSFLTAKKNSPVNISNWQFANVSLAVWNSILNTECALPLLSFEKTTSQKASYTDNNTWQWFSRFNADTLGVKARLKGKQHADSVEWKLLISTFTQNSASQEFVWLEGKSAANQSGGWWMIYEKPENPVPFIKIVWSKNDHPSNKYILVKPNDPHTGEYLEYGPLNSGLYNSYYYLKLHQQNFIHIELNKASKEGHIRSEMLFNNNLWHCWNSSFENMLCE